MDFIPYKVNEYLENTFYQVPKELFTNPYYKKLNSDSILLYNKNCFQVLSNFLENSYKYGRGDRDRTCDLMVNSSEIDQNQSNSKTVANTGFLRKSIFK